MYACVMNTQCLHVTKKMIIFQSYMEIVKYKCRYVEGTISIMFVRINIDQVSAGE